MKPNRIQLTRKITNQLLHHAQSFPQQEICGLIGAKQGIPCHCYSITNTAICPTTEFLLDPQQQIEVMSKMRDRDEQLFAIYHSHPTAPATPSITDIQLASYPDAIQLIISLNTRGVLELRGYKINSQTVQELTLQMVE